MKKLLLFAVVVLGFSAVSFGQSSVTAGSEASAVILRSLGINKVANLDFAKITVGATGGDVTVSPVTNLATSSLALMGTASAASFDVTGDLGHLVTITIPTADILLTHTDGTTTMTVGTFTSTPATTLGTGTTNLSAADGTLNIKVGAKLTVLGNQKAGTYTNATAFDVTVAYN